MANPFQDALTESIDYLIQNRVGKLDRDKTVIATIVSCTNALEAKYKVNYNNGFITAYSMNIETIYKPNQTVYVLVPEGDFTKKLMIVGVASTTAGDNNITFVSSMLNDYNTVGDNVISDPEGLYPFGLRSYLHEDSLLLYKSSEVDDGLPKPQKQLKINTEKFDTYIKDDSVEALLIEATFQTRLPRAHRVSKTGEYGINFNLVFKDLSNSDKESIRTYSYILDTHNMAGNPLQYEKAVDQNIIFPIDAKNFLYIESITAFSRNFVEEDNREQAELWKADIFIRDLEIYGLRKIDTSNGDYRLKIFTPDGATFKTTEASETLSIIGQTTYQIGQDISDTTSYYWFSKDDRITSSSPNGDYQMYGGRGWKYLKDKGNSKKMVTNGMENRAYENKYLCVAVYKENVILKNYFTLYNEAAKRLIEIESNLGTVFCFDRGTPELTCKVNGHPSNFDQDIPSNKKPDDYYLFCWSKTNQDGSILTFDKTIQQLQDEIEKVKRQQLELEADTTWYGTLQTLQNQLTQMQGVTVNKNVLNYPVKGIDTSATFSCSVYLKDTPDGEYYFIGSAEITLLNENAAKPNDYLIVIENGEQVFQYSESGVSPASERYTNPLEIKPLTCHFYDPAGLEVDNSTYNVKWRVPLESTMLVIPEENLRHFNPATGLREWYDQAIYPTKITEDWDYQCQLNQVQCIVTYNGQEYTRYSEFLFVKVGDNGTNGTDYVAKIDEIDGRINNEPLVLQVDSSGRANFNTGQSITENVLRFELYNRNERVIFDSAAKKNVKWSIQGGNNYSKNLELTKSNDELQITWNPSKKITGQPKTNQIIKGEVTISSTDSDIRGNQTYYAYYPLPVVTYPNIYSIGGKITFDDQYLLKQVLYNADGRNPLFNKNQGICFRLTGSAAGASVTLTAKGGYQDSTNGACMTLSADRSDDKGSTSVTISQGEDGKYMCYVIPSMTYNGEFSNNRVEGTVNGKNISFVVPIQFMLNTYGLASLNGWDGNHIELNTEENYILAPQIGAGIKNSQNQFTGIVMGQAKTYDSKTYKSDGDSVGLLGYSKGQQSIWLDAETGKAVFGLPSDFAQQGNEQLEGRIELIPGGTSHIGSWKIGANSLYNAKTKNGGDDVNAVGAQYPSATQRRDQVSTRPSSSSGYNKSTNGTFIQKNYQGVVLSASPPYLSVKTAELDLGDPQLDNDNGNNLLLPGDAVEVELNPNKLSVFTIYRHTGNGSSWKREAMAGINANGEFYSNALQHADTNLGLGFIGAFSSAAADKLYVGSRLGVGRSGSSNTNVVKFFTPVASKNSSNITSSSILYITGGTKQSDEYERPLSLHGRTVTLYASNTSSALTTPNYIQIKVDEAFIGKTEGSRLELKNNSQSTLFINNSFNHEVKNATTIKYGSTLNQTVVGATTLDLQRETTITSKAITLTTNTGNFKGTIAGSTTWDSTQDIAFIRGNTTSLKLTGTTATLSQSASNYIEVGGNIKINTGGTAEVNPQQFIVNAKGNVEIHADGHAGTADMGTKEAILMNGGKVTIIPALSVSKLLAPLIFASGGGDSSFRFEAPVQFDKNTTYSEGLTVNPEKTSTFGAITVAHSSTFKENLTVDWDLTVKGGNGIKVEGGNIVVNASPTNIILDHTNGVISADNFNVPNVANLRDVNTTANTARDTANSANGKIDGHTSASNPHGITCSTIGAQPAGNYALRSEIPDVSGIEDGKNALIIARANSTAINGLAARVAALEGR